MHKDKHKTSLEYRRPRVDPQVRVDYVSGGSHKWEALEHGVTIAWGHAKLMRVAIIKGHLAVRRHQKEQEREASPTYSL